MGRGEQRAVEQLRVEARFVFPDVEHTGMAAPQQCVAVDHFAARGVHHYGVRFQAGEQSLAGHVPRRGVKRRVKGEYVGLACDLVQRQESAMLALFARRVAADDAEAPQAGVFPDEGSHVPHAHDAQRPLCGLPSLCTGEVGQYGTRPLQDAAGIAACGRGDPYAVRRAPRRVDVVEPDGGRGDQTDARTGEQAFVAAGAGADDQGVGVAHVLRGDPAAGQVAYLGPRLEDSLQKGDGTVGDDFHGWLLFPDFFSFREANIGKK